MNSAAAQKMLVVLPAFNESASIETVLSEVSAHVPLDQVVVVDDGSTDGTARIARGAGAVVVVLPFNVGVGGALRAGLLLARRSGTSVVVQCDADGQHPPEAIPSLLEALAGNDIVIGARFAGTGDYEVRGLRKYAITMLAWTMSRLHRTKLTDVTSGFRAFGPRAIDVLSTHMPAEYLGDTVEALVIAKEHGLRVTQIPVHMRERQGGVASHGPIRSAIYLVRAITMIVLSTLRLLGTRGRRSKENSGAA